MSAKIIKKAKITSDGNGKEDDELKSMSYYMDDRLELVKQIFSTLKPKTIKSLSPDFLKNSTIEEIEELCLNELLGISSKRLKSIINATKCPTDTESSDSNNEDGMSLEEISSDSEADGHSSRRKVNKNGSGRLKNKNLGNNPEGNVDDKEISVLELLELQARARAIRSQLALEPIAKVELDDEDEKDVQSKNRLSSNSNRKPPSTSQKSSRDHSANVKSEPNFSSRSEAKEGGSSRISKTYSTQASNQSSASTSNSKPIKLKRNFNSETNSNNYSEVSQKSHNEKQSSSSSAQQQQKLTSSSEKSREINERSKNGGRNHKAYYSDKMKNGNDHHPHHHHHHKKHSDRHLERSSHKSSKIDSNENRSKAHDHRKTGRSPSPDVLAILPSPEVLSVSDSSEEENHKVRIKKEKKDVVSSSSSASSSESSESSASEESDTTLSSSESSEEEEEEDEVLKEKVIEKKILKKVTKPMEDLRTIIQRKKNEKPQGDTENNQNKNDSFESDTSKNTSNEKVVDDKQKNNISTEDKIDPGQKDKIISKENETESSSTTLKDTKQPSAAKESDDNLPKDPRNKDVMSLPAEKLLNCEICKEKPTIVYNKLDEDHHNDDAISLGDAELDYGINEHIEERSSINVNIPDTPMSPEVNQSEPEMHDEDEKERNDYITLHDSSNEDVGNADEGSSWNDRYLRSSKVSKILTASKLAKKVRDKVKKAKEAEKEEELKKNLQKRKLEEKEIAEKRKVEEYNKKVLSKFEEGSVKQFEKIKEIVKSPKK